MRKVIGVKRKLHLICNAHLDPVWQWEWEEGAAAAVSTFRAAASFCEEYGGFVFNHNEALLYRWIEEYEPELMVRIKRLVEQGRWHIMGGWYLQPDCNMPSGESIVRQIIMGRTYFRNTFGAKPTTSINFDSFGHSRGLVQIMKQAGFDSYLFMRPEAQWAGPQQEFMWVGFDGSEVMAFQVQNGYNSLLGQSRSKLERWLQEHPDKQLGMVLWGVGNHGGGPSRTDLDQIGQLMKERQDHIDIVHSTPECYFSELSCQAGSLPRFENDLNPRFVGCYTSMIRIKQKHRLLENELYATEKMLASAAMQGFLVYPKQEMDDAFHDLMVSEFHDILPGSSVQPAEESALRLMDHGLEIASRLKARAFFALASGQQQAREGEYPILVYNPHPYPVRGSFECEFMLADQNWNEEFSMPVVFQDGARIPSQPEKEFSNLTLDWRKRVVFHAELAPSSMNRFDCRIELLPRKPQPQLNPDQGVYRFATGELEVVINAFTGLMDRYRVQGVDYLKPGAFLPQVIADNEDPWRMDTNRFEPVIGQFRLMDPGAGTDFSGVKGVMLPSVRVVEDGEVRTVIEAVLEYGRSALCMTYKLPKRGTKVEVQVRLYWNEKDKLLKLAIPTCLEQSTYQGQTVYGVQKLPVDGTESVAQKWTMLADEQAAVSLINNGVYGSDAQDGVMRPTLIRGSGYTAHPIEQRPIMPTDRFSPRIDQGERSYTFWLNAGQRIDRLERIDREASGLNEKPYALSFFPHGEGRLPQQAAVLDDPVIQLTAMKRTEDNRGYAIRLFEPTGTSRSTTIRIPCFGLQRQVNFKGFELKTLFIDPLERTISECTLLESTMEG